MRKRVVPKSGKSAYFDSRQVAELVDIDTGKSLAPIFDWKTANKFASKYGQPPFQSVDTPKPIQIQPPISPNLSTDAVLHRRENANRQKLVEVSSIVNKVIHRQKPVSNVSELPKGFTTESWGRENNHAELPTEVYKPLNPYDKFTRYDLSHGHLPGFFTAWDIETGAVGEVISSGLVKYAFDLQGHPEIVDYREDFFQYHPKGLSANGGIATQQGREALQIHGLTPEEVIRRGATHVFGEKDRQDILNFISDSKLVGYNIWGGSHNIYEGFDLKKVFDINTINKLVDKGGVLDLFMLYKDSFKQGRLRTEALKMSKDDLVRFYTGKTPRALGFDSHGALADVLLEGPILHALSLQETGNFGKLVNAASAPGVTYTGYDEFNVFRKNKTNYSVDLAGIEPGGKYMGNGTTQSIAQDLYAIRTSMNAFTESLDNTSKKMFSTVNQLGALNTNALTSRINTEVGIVKSYIEAESSGNTARMDALKTKYSHLYSNWDTFYDKRKNAALKEIEAEQYDIRSREEEAFNVRKADIRRWAHRRGLDETYNSVEQSFEYGTSDIEDLKDYLAEHAERFGNNYRSLLWQARKQNNTEALNILGSISSTDTDDEAFYKMKDAQEALGKATEDATKKLQSFHKGMMLFNSALRLAGSIIDSVHMYNMAGYQYRADIAKADLSLPTWSAMDVYGMAVNSFNTTSGVMSKIIPSSIMEVFNGFGASALNRFSMRSYNFENEWKAKEIEAQKVKVAKDKEAAAYMREAREWQAWSNSLSTAGHTLIGAGAIAASSGAGTLAGGIIAGAGALSSGAGLYTQYRANSYMELAADYQAQGLEALAVVQRQRSEASLLNFQKTQQLAQNVGQLIQAPLNLMAGTISGLTAPFRLLGTVVKTVTGLLSKFGIGLSSFTMNTVNSMGQLGNPLTNLTGVNYASYTGLNALDSLAGLGRGSLNAAANSFAVQQQQLYGMGRYDTSRLVAASILGVFDQVYSINGNSQDHLISTIDKLSRDMRRDPSQRHKIMGLAGSIDNSIPAVLEALSRIQSLPQYAGVTAASLTRTPAGGRGYNTLGTWVHPLSENERNRMAVAYTQLDKASETFQNNKQRLGLNIWESIGHDIFNWVNKNFDQIVNLITSSNLFKSIKTFIEDVVNSDDVGTALDKITSKLSDIGTTVWTAIRDPILRGLSGVAGSIYNIFGQILIKGASMLDRLIGTFNEFYIDEDVLKNALEAIAHNANPFRIGGIKEVSFEGLIGRDPSRNPYNKAEAEYEADMRQYERDLREYGRKKTEAAEKASERTSLANSLSAKKSELSGLIDTARSLGIDNIETLLNEPESDVKTFYDIWRKAYAENDAEIAAAQQAGEVGELQSRLAKRKQLNWLINNYRYAYGLNSDILRIGEELSHSASWDIEVPTKPTKHDPGFAEKAVRSYVNSDLYGERAANGIIDAFSNIFDDNTLKVDVNLSVTGDAKKDSENHYSIPDLLSITIDSVTTAFGGNLAGALKEASVEGR